MRSMSLPELLMGVIWAIVPVVAIIAGVVIQWFRTQWSACGFLSKRACRTLSFPLYGPRGRRPSPEEVTAGFRVAGMI